VHFKTGTPIDVNFIARLQDTALFLRITAPDQSRMASVFACQKMDDDRGFSMLAKAQDDAVISPVHC
jgi:hypothetical protein